MTELILEREEKVDRRSGIGGSEISSILGLNRYTSAFDVWLEKTGRAPEENEQSEAARWGKILERPIAAEYERRTGRTLVLMFDEPIRHPDRPYQIGSPDALVPSESIDVEIKAPGLRQAYRYGPEGTDEVPDEHFLQVQWYLSLTGYERGHLAVLLGGQDFRIYELTRNRELEEVMLAKAFEFWRDHVQADVPPPVSATEKTRDYLRAMFPHESLGIRDATESEALLARQLVEAKQATAAAEKREEELANAIRFAIGDAAGLNGSGFRVSWKAAKPSVKVDWEAAFTELRNEIGLLLPALSLPQPVRDADLVRRIDSIVAAYTTTKPGSRRLLLNAKELTK